MYNIYVYIRFVTDVFLLRNRHFTHTESKENSFLRPPREHSKQWKQSRHANCDLSHFYCRKRQSLVLAERDLGQLLQLFHVSRCAVADHRAQGGNHDYAIFHRLQPLFVHPNNGSLHIHLLQVSCES